jgi:hypothetical protein
VTPMRVCPKGAAGLNEAAGCGQSGLVVTLNFPMAVRSSARSFVACTIGFVVLLMLRGDAWQQAVILLTGVGGAVEFGLLCWHWRQEWPAP